MFDQFRQVMDVLKEKDIDEKKAEILHRYWLEHTTAETALFAEKEQGLTAEKATLAASSIEKETKKLYAQRLTLYLVMVVILIAVLILFVQSQFIFFSILFGIFLIRVVWKMIRFLPNKKLKD